MKNKRKLARLITQSLQYISLYCVISLANFRLLFNLLLIRSSTARGSGTSISLRWSLQKLTFKELNSRPKRAVFFSKGDDIKIKGKSVLFFFLRQVIFLLLRSSLYGTASVGVLQGKMALALRRSETTEGLTLKTSLSESLYGGQFTISAQLIEPNYHDCEEFDT